MRIRGTGRAAAGVVAVALASNGLVGTTAIWGAARPAYAGSAAGVTRPVPSSCFVTVGAIDRAGGYVERGVDLMKGTSREVLRHPGVFPAGSVTALSSYELFATDIGGGPAWLASRGLSAVSGGRLVSATVQTTAGISGEPDGTRVKTGASRRGWGGFTQLVQSDYSVQKPDGSVIGARVRLYGLTKAGVLYRYTRSTAAVGEPPWRSAGTVSGFGAVRSISLIGQNATSDVLLANTSTGSLITIRVAAHGPMRTTVTGLRDRGWNGLEYLVADRCNRIDTVATTGLVGIDADTGAAYGYRLGFASGRRTTITPVGRIGSGWTDAAYARQWFDVSGLPLRGA